MSSFDPSKLGGGGKGSGQSKPRAERLFVAVESYETPADGFHYAVGRRVDNPDEVVKVRLTTVSERVADWPDVSVESVESDYAERGGIADKAKKNMPLLSFDEAYRVGVDDRGVAEYRAHYIKTMATNPQAEVVMGIANVSLSDGTEKSRPKALVMMLKESAIVDRDNIEEALGRALSVKDEQGRSRDPEAIVRVYYEGKLVSRSELFPERTSTSVFNQKLGKSEEKTRKADSDVTLAKLLGPEPAEGFSEHNTLHRDLVRALVAGVKGDPEPRFATADANERNKARQHYYGAKEGALQIEVIAVERYPFGGESAKTYLAAKDKPPLKFYREESVEGDYKKNTALFGDTVIAVQRNDEGQPFAIFASPAEMWSKSIKNSMSKLSEIPPGSLPRMELSADAAKTLDKAVPPVAEPEERQPATADYDDGPSM